VEADGKRSLALFREGLERVIPKAEALRGGALLDMIGFSAAIFHRGIRLIRIPTTTLAQNDAGIWGAG